MKRIPFAVLAVLAVFVAQADVVLSDLAGGSTAPGTAELVATVQGTGDVFATYAPVPGTSRRSVKERYVTEGLLAMWDAVDNMGHGGHAAAATTWRDLTGRHADMRFTAPPTIGADFYDLSAGGCGVAAPDIAAAINNGAATVEIVCRVRSIQHDATVFACVDGVDQAAGNRIAWARSVNGSGFEPAVLGAVEYKAAAYSVAQRIDGKTGVPRNYAFLYNATQCVVATNGVWATTVSSKGVNGVPANGWFSLGQRISMGGESATISDIQIHSVRVYDHYLTDSERLRNFAVDQERFFAPPSVDLDAADTRAETVFAGTVAAPFAGAKDYYVQDGLIALWDGEDNQGTGEHVPDATTWTDLTRNHAAMQFDTAPTIGANYYDVSQGGGCVKSCVDIAQAIQAKNATVEIVCDVRSFVDSGTLVSLVDGNAADGSAGNRLLWVMNGALGSNHQGVIGTIDYLTAGSTTPYPSYDTTTNEVRSYSFKFDNARCSVFRNGSSTVGKTKVIGNNGTVTLGNANTACFSIGQRYSQTGKSGFISDMRVYCVRVYNRELTAAEIAANHEADVKRFFGGAGSAWPLGSFLVRQADGTKILSTGGKGVFRVFGLRPDATVYTARLFTTNDTPSATPSTTFESAAERPAATWFESLDSRLLPATASRTPNTVIDLGFTPNGRVPVVESRYQILGGLGHAVFGVNNDEWGTYVGLFNDDNVLKFRYRIGDAGDYAVLEPGELTGVHELSFNGPEGTVLNGRVLDAQPAGKVDVGTEPWRLFGRWIGGQYRYNEPGSVRVWYFRLWADDVLLRDLVPAKFSDGRMGMFDRVNRYMLTNIGTMLLTQGAELPAPEIVDAEICGATLGLKLVRTGTVASDVYIVSGTSHGGAVLGNWARAEKLAQGFAEGQTELVIQDRVARAAGARYVRFLSLQDGWSASVFLPDTPERRGLMVIIR